MIKLYICKNFKVMINEEKFAENYVHFDREIVVEIIDIFIEEYDERIEKISHHLKTKNPDELLKCAHAFKGVISNFETECSAYTEIAEMETASHVFTHNFTSEAGSSNEKEDEYYKQLEEVFVSFKKNSKKILYQLKDLRKNYTD